MVVRRGPKSTALERSLSGPATRKAGGPEATWVVVARGSTASGVYSLAWRILRPDAPTGQRGSGPSSVGIRLGARCGRCPHRAGADSHTGLAGTASSGHPPGSGPPEIQNGASSVRPGRQVGNALLGNLNPVTRIAAPPCRTATLGKGTAGYRLTQPCDRCRAGRAGPRRKCRRDRYRARPARGRCRRSARPRPCESSRARARAR